MLEYERVNVTGGILAENTIDMPIAGNYFARIRNAWIRTGKCTEGLLCAFRKKTLVFGPVNEQYGHSHAIDARKVKI